MKPIGPYVAARELPAGANGASIRTLRATDRLTGMPVLLHVLPYAPNLPELPEHPHLLPFVDSGMDGELAYVVTELPLQAAPASDATLAARGALQALAALHARGLAHGGVGAAQLWSIDGQVVLAGAGLPWHDQPTPHGDLRDLARTLGEIGVFPAALRPLLATPDLLDAPSALALLEVPPAPPAAPARDLPELTLQAGPTDEDGLTDEARPTDEGEHAAGAARPEAQPSPDGPPPPDRHPGAVAHDGSPIVLGEDAPEGLGDADRPAAVQPPAPPTSGPTGPLPPAPSRSDQADSREQAVHDAPPRGKSRKGKAVIQRPTGRHPSPADPPPEPPARPVPAPQVSGAAAAPIPAAAPDMPPVISEPAPPAPGRVDSRPDALPSATLTPGAAQPDPATPPAGPTEAPPSPAALPGAAPAEVVPDRPGAPVPAYSSAPAGTVETPQERRRRQNEERRAQAILDAQAAAQRKAERLRAEARAAPPATIQIGFPTGGPSSGPVTGGPGQGGSGQGGAGQGGAGQGGAGQGRVVLGEDDLPDWTPPAASPADTGVPGTDPHVPAGPRLRMRTVERLPESLRRPPEPEPPPPDEAMPLGRLPARHAPGDPIRIGWDEDDSWRVVKTGQPPAPGPRPRLPRWVPALLGAALLLGVLVWIVAYAARALPAQAVSQPCCDVTFTLRGAAGTTAHLTVEAAPADASLLPGQDLGVAPGTLHFPLAGEYRLRILADGYAPGQLTLKVPRTQPVMIDLGP